MGLGASEDIFSPLDGKLREPEFYHALGFQSGLEIHQQLATEKKLFCHCPAGIYVKDHDAVILRHMRPTLSELGEYDGTALMEFKTKKDIVYLLNRLNVCTYEMDDTPPFMMNSKALDIALEIALLSGCQIVNEVHVIRKQYLDGSIPTGFQRTAIVGVNGCVPFRGRNIGIIQVAVEEDSCREVSSEGHRITFRTDRLNMPLSETVTAPDMRTPEEVAAVCDLLRRLARVTGNVRRGAGSARQDVNVSVEGGRRVEIKGVSSIGYIPFLVHNEALRQRRLLFIRQQLKELGLTSDNLDGGSVDVSKHFAQTDVCLLQKALLAGETIRVQVLRKCRKILRAYIQPGLRFAQELSGRVRIIACLDSPVNVFVRDEVCGIGLASHNVSHGDSSRFVGPSLSEWEQVAQYCDATEDDGLVLVWGSQEDTMTAAEEIRSRMVEALEGIPCETRKPFPNGTTDFERILPGPNRMYPDTDLPPVSVKDEKVQAIVKGLAQPPWLREEKLTALGLSPALASNMAISPHHELFLRLSHQKGFFERSKTVAWFLLQLPVALRRKGIPVQALQPQDYETLAEFFLAQKIYREGLPVVLERLSHVRTQESVEGTKENSHTWIDRIFRKEFPGHKKGMADVSVAEIEKISESFPPKSFRTHAAFIHTVMKELMKKHWGRVNASHLRDKVEQWCAQHCPPGKADSPIQPNTAPKDLYAKA